MAAELIADFAGRMKAAPFDPEEVTGAQRSKIRSVAGDRKRQKTLAELTVPSLPAAKGGDEAGAGPVDVTKVLTPAWLSEADAQLRLHELLLVRFGKKCGIQKKAAAKVAGLQIAAEVGAHVAQVLGHTTLLYRPAGTPETYGTPERITFESGGEGADADVGADNRGPGCR